MIPTNCSSLPELLAVLDLASLRPKAGQAGHVGTCVSSLGGYLGYIFAMFDSNMTATNHFLMPAFSLLWSCVWCLSQVAICLPTCFLVSRTNPRQSFSQGGEEMDVRDLSHLRIGNGAVWLLKVDLHCIIGLGSPPFWFSTAWHTWAPICLFHGFHRRQAEIFWPKSPNSFSLIQDIQGQVL